jgi:hypothetical protein
MKVVVVSSLAQRGTRLGALDNNAKLSGPLSICEMVRAIGGEATTVDYFDKWNINVLAECLCTWFGDEKHIVIGTSGSINDGNTILFARLCSIIRQTLPHLKVVLGGYRVITGNASWVDVSFIGRCKNLVRDWLLGNDISKFQVSSDPPSYRNPYNSIQEDPVSPIMVPGDLGSAEELITIELSLGCKFNCSFCGYDYRNNRTPLVNTVDRVVESCQTAYDLFGMTNFFLADDTINEVNSKLEVLAEVSNQLSFTPEFMAFARLDVMGAKPEQIELMQKGNLKTMFFGIESLNPAVTKDIRKGGKPERNYDIMRMIKRDFPEAFTYGNFIIGLEGDSEADIWKHMHKIVDEQLLTSAGCNALRIYNDLDNWENMSDIDRDPGKFGYKLSESTSFAGQYGYDANVWTNSWTDYNKASALSSEVDQYLSANLSSAFTAHEQFSIKTMMPGLSHANYAKLLPTLNRKARSIQSKYILRKSLWLKS